MKPGRHAYPVLAVLAMLIVLPMAGLVAVGSLGADPAELAFWQSKYIRRVLVFSLWQSLLSSFLSVSLALLVAQALVHRGEFILRSLLLKLFGLPLVVPSVRGDCVSPWRWAWLEGSLWVAIVSL